MNNAEPSSAAFHGRPQGGTTKQRIGWGSLLGLGLLVVPSLAGTPELSWPAWTGLALDPWLFPSAVMVGLVLVAAFIVHRCNQRNRQRWEQLAREKAATLEREHTAAIDRAEAQLAEERRTVRALIDQLPEYVAVLDAEDRFILANRPLAQALGTTPDRLIGQPPGAFSGALAGCLAVKTTAIGEAATPVESLWPQSDGTPRWILAWRMPRRDGEGHVTGSLFVGVDITSRKQAEEALQSREELYRALFEGIPDAWFVFAIEPDRTAGRFLEANPTACDRLGYSRDELLQLKPGDVIAANSPASDADVIRALEHGPAATVEQVHVARDGRQIPVELKARRFEWGGRPAIIAQARDITGRKRVEEEKRQLEQRVQQAQKLESLGVLAGGIAHDFNNLLTAILGRIDLALLEIPPGVPARAHLVGAQKASRNAADLCRQMLAYSGKGRFVVEPVDLGRIVEDMGHMLSVSISKKALLRYNFAPRLPRIEADAAQIRQVVLNLVMNASEAIGDKSGFVSISTGVKSCTRADLAKAWLGDALSEGTYVYLEVADTGCGMDEATLVRIFEPFFTTKFTGRGLGLAAVLGIVRGHRGAIEVHSIPQRGTTFRVLFPSAEPAAVQSEEPPGPPGEWRGTGTILLVDDEESVLATAKNMLEWLGYEVITAENGEVALERYQANSKVISCVILDLTMPHMDGEEAFTELRRRRADLPVVLSSGYDEQELAQRFAGKGLSAFIQKPYTVEDLVRVLRGVAVG